MDIEKEPSIYKAQQREIKEENKAKKVFKDLCELIDMKRFGDTTVVDFGTNERVSGFSMTQLIETSLISAHFANVSKAIYLDVFSCKAFAPYKVAEFAKERFKASGYEVNVNFRY